MDQPAAGQPDITLRSFGEITCIQGSCIDVLSFMTLNPAAMVFCDLPYGSTDNIWDQQIPLDILWQSLEKVCLPSAAQVFSATQPFATKLISSNVKMFRYDLIWHKNMASGFLNANKQPLRAHEHLLIFYKKLPKYTPQKTILTKETNTNRTSVTNTANYSKKNALRKTWVADGTRHPTSVQAFKLDTGKQRGLHPTQKPVALLEWLIATYTNPGDIVLDPTAGSGTTGIAALNLGRRAILIEKDPTYFEVMCKRIAEHQQKMEAARE